MWLRRAVLIISAFSWPKRSSRFSDGSFGVYNAARMIETAIAETVYHPNPLLGRHARADGREDGAARRRA